jgi:hypothetical protein
MMVSDSATENKAPKNKKQSSKKQKIKTKQWLQTYGGK